MKAIEIYLIVLMVMSWLPHIAAFLSPQASGAGITKTRDVALKISLACLPALTLLHFSDSIK